MKVKRRRNQVNQRRFIANFSIAEQFRRADVAPSPVRFDTAPVIDALEDVLAILGHFQFDHD